MPFKARKIRDAYSRRYKTGLAVVGLAVSGGYGAMLAHVGMAAAGVIGAAWLLTLLVLIVEAFVLFRPFGRLVEDSVKTLEETEAASNIAAEAARKANESNANFLRIISHEIRTPLYAVTGISQLLRSQKVSADAAEQIRHLSAASDQLIGLAENVLDFSKLKTGELALAAGPYNLRDELAKCADIIEPLLKAKGLSLSLDFTELSAACFDGDAPRLRQIVLNLLTNALKFTDRGTISLSCRAIREAPGETVFRIRVTDTGIGVAPDAREQIFRSFEQLGALETRRHGGAGLGLAIVSELVKAMGGTVSLESELGAGSSFSIVLPLRKSTRTAPETTAPPVARSVHQRVLVVEDNVPNQMIAEAFLKAAGFDVVIANNGEEAIEAVSREKFDLVLMDINMPVMDGLEATRILRQNPDYKKTPILAFTAHAIDEDRSTLLNAGLNDILKKPVTEKGLVDRVKLWIANDDPAPKSDAA
jgi:signal transduction histidine kinase/ActR/RegA family two-component response regulator